MPWLSSAVEAGLERRLVARGCDSHHLLSSHALSGHMDQVGRMMMARFSRHTYTVGYCCHLGDSGDLELGPYGAGT